MYRRKALITPLVLIGMIGAATVPPTLAKEPAALAKAAPDAVGFSTQRLNRISTVLKKEVADGKLPGAVVMVARKGKINQCC